MNLDDDEQRATNKNTFEHKYEEMYKELCKYIDLYNAEKEEKEMKDRIINLMAQDIATYQYCKEWVIEHYKYKAEIQKQVKEMLE